ncbi:MAG: lipopolysaccharide heptosyltransferase I [Desulfarculus sp.]|nr:lipopolysaccharide heptosyltransferase I [Desulfarculus sp.]
MKVLIVKLSALGDVVQSLPVAMAIRGQVPQAQVDWLVEAPSAGLLEGHPALSRVLVSPRRRPGGRSLGQVRQWLKVLRAVEYDAVLDLQGLMKSAIFVGLGRGRRKIGFSGGKEPLAAWALTERLPAYDPQRHALERYLDLLGPLGLERPAPPRFGLEPQAPALAKAEALLAGRRPGRQLVVLHPVAKWESKLWPVAHWARLARLLHQAGLDLVLSGSAADRGVTQAMAGQAGLAEGLWDLAGAVSLKELAAVLSLADLTVATDTGVMHLAAALGRPVVALFGPTSPGRTGPYGAGHVVLRLGLECSPCFRRNCPAPRCLTGLEPEEVALAALSRLDQARP